MHIVKKFVAVGKFRPLQIMINKNNNIAADKIARYS